MSELAEAFRSLPPDYRNVLQLAQDSHGISVMPLDELTGGRTGAGLYLVSVAHARTARVEHLVLKLDRKGPGSRVDELERHQSALTAAPAVFSRNRIASLALDRVERDGAVAIFYGIAGQSLHNYRPLASFERQPLLEALFRKTNEVLLDEWNGNLAVRQAVHPQALLSSWLGYRLQTGGNIETFLESDCGVSAGTAGLLIQGQVFPNPLLFAREAGPWQTARSVDTIVGFQHGDVNIANILARFDETGSEVEGYYIIDFALYKPDMPLLYDQRYLEMSYLIREVSRVPFAKWVGLVTRYAAQDFVDPSLAPIELSGACAVIGAGRSSFSEWVEATNPTLADDLWGQYWLAGVAAGLNYCNKTAITREERLAGLIFAAAGLRRYHEAFGVDLPTEVRHVEVKQAAVTSRNVPPERSSAARRNNLPVQPTEFIGRKTELEKTKNLLSSESIRLVTLFGPGGTGKTRTAVQAATELAGRFDDGVYFVDLALVRDAASVLPAIAETLGLRETGSVPLLDEFSSHVREQVLLIVLDNFEHVSAAAPDIGHLLSGSVHLKLLVTSREPLRVRGEQVLAVPPLELPEVGETEAAEVGRCEAVRLFVERAQAVSPAFELTNENASQVASICRELDGLPLAIELAAARVRLFSPQAMLDRVGNRLKLLRGGAKDLPERHQTLSGTIDWSYNLLDPEEQRLFVSLAVFSDWTFEAVEAFASTMEFADGGPDVLDGLVSLLDKSLVRRVEPARRAGGNEPDRMTMLETIREYAVQRLGEDSELENAVRRAHAAYFTEFTRGLWGRLTGTDRETALDMLESDIGNVRTAWRYWVEQQHIENLHKLTDSLWVLYDVRGRYHALAGIASDLLDVLGGARAGRQDAEQEILLQMSVARILLALNGYTPEVERAYTRALELCDEHGAVPQQFPVLRGLCSYYVYRTEFDRADQVGRQILELAERADDDTMKVEGLVVHGYSTIFNGHPIEGLEILDQAIALYDPDRQSVRRLRFGNNPGVVSRVVSALIRWMLGFPDTALALANDAVALGNRVNHPFSLAYALFHTGLLHLWRREAELAIGRAEALLDVADEHDYQIWRAVGTCLRGAGMVETDRAAEGLELIRAGMELYQGLKTRPPVFWPMLLSMQAGALTRTGQPDEGLRLANMAAEMPASAYDAMAAEYIRLRGEILLAVSSDNEAAAEQCFQNAYNLASNGQALMLELRAAMSLNRLRDRQGQTAEGRQLLRAVYEKFSEGFETMDLTEVRAIIER